MHEGRKSCKHPGPPETVTRDDEGDHCNDAMTAKMLLTRLNTEKAVLCGQ